MIKRMYLVNPKGRTFKIEKTTISRRSYSYLNNDVNLIQIMNGK